MILLTGEIYLGNQHCMSIFSLNFASAFVLSAIRGENLKISSLRDSLHFEMPGQATSHAPHGLMTLTKAPGCSEPPKNPVM